MRKTQSTIALRCMDPELCYKLLSTLNQYEGVTAIFEGGCSKERISEVHRNNKTVAFSSPYRVMENLNEGIIVINAFEGSCPTKVQDYFENIVLIGPGHPTLECQIKAIADKYDLDLGDFIPQEENGLVAHRDSKQNCLLCNIYQADKQARIHLEENDQFRTDPSLMNIVLYESEYFYVVPAKGALVRGYVMIVPKEHHLSFAALPHEQLVEGLQVLQDLQEIFGKIYHTQDFLVFEHGSGKEGACKHEKSIVHAHLHVMPYASVMDADIMDKFQLKSVSIDQISQYKDVPYLLYRDSQIDWHISANPDVYLPRQCVRQLVGDHIGLKGQLWNWRRHSFMDEIEDTVGSYYRYLQSCYFTLEPRIAQATAGFMLQMNRRSVKK